MEMAQERVEAITRGKYGIGVEIGWGSGSDPVTGHRDLLTTKGLPGLEKWDFKARGDIDNLGGRVIYRTEHLRSFSVGFLKYLDILETLRLGSTRDRLASQMGIRPEKTIGGFQVETSGVFNQYLGGITSYDRKIIEKSVENGKRTTDKATFEVESNYWPLGDNLTKKWNAGPTASLRYDKAAIRQGDYNLNDEGFGYSAGLAYQYAFNYIPLPRQESSDKFFELGRFKTRMVVVRSPVASTSIKTAAELSFYLFKNLELTTGVNNVFIPSLTKHDPDERTMNFSGGIGIDWRGDFPPWKKKKKRQRR